MATDVGRFACSTCRTSTCSSTDTGAANTCKDTFAYYAIETSANTDFHSTIGKNEISCGEEIARAEDADSVQVGASSEATCSGAGGGNAGTANTIGENFVPFLSTSEAWSITKEARGAQDTGKVEISVEAYQGQGEGQGQDQGESPVESERPR